MSISATAIPIHRPDIPRTIRFRLILGLTNSVVKISLYISLFSNTPSAWESTGNSPKSTPVVVGETLSDSVTPRANSYLALCTTLSKEKGEKQY